MFCFQRQWLTLVAIALSCVSDYIQLWHLTCCTHICAPWPCCIQSHLDLDFKRSARLQTWRRIFARGWPLKMKWSPILVVSWSMLFYGTIWSSAFQVRTLLLIKRLHRSCNLRVILSHDSELLITSWNFKLIQVIQLILSVVHW